MIRSEDLPLFQAFPGLGRAIEHLPLGNFPTPVERLDRLGTAYGNQSIFIKRDDRSGRLYGGNKVRKLEFLLGKIRASGSQALITFGYAGSNHALATALYSQQLGLHCQTYLLPQANANYVRKNLLWSWQAGAEIIPCRHMADLLLRLSRAQFLAWLETGQIRPMIPPGGSSPLGTLGYINAAFELHEQIESGQLPLPSRIYVPLGSLGTVAGLLIGFKLRKLPITIHAVRVVHGTFANGVSVRQLLTRTVDFLQRIDPAFPRLKWTGAEWIIRPEFFGSGYARFTPAGCQAMRQLQELEGIQLDGTYTAKTLAALLEDMRTRPELGPSLFWNTFSSQPEPIGLSAIAYQRLPAGVHRYFEEDIQPLDFER